MTSDGKSVPPEQRRAAILACCGAVAFFLGLKLAQWGRDGYRLQWITGPASILMLVGLVCAIIGLLRFAWSRLKS